MGRWDKPEAFVAVTKITDENRSEMLNIALASAEAKNMESICVVCGSKVGKSQYWKVHEGCIGLFRENKDYFLGIDSTSSEP